MPSPNQAKRDQFMDLLSEYTMQEVSYTLADGAQATEAKKDFDWRRRKAHKAILEFVFPAKEDTPAETADQQPNESPADNALMPSFLGKRTMNSTTGLDELKDRIDSLTQQLKTPECKCHCNQLKINRRFAEALSMAALAANGANT